MPNTQPSPAPTQQPPPAALKAASEAVLNDPKIHSYGPDGGSAELINALKAKLRSENGIENSEVMVTCGANQAFMNAVIALCDSDSPVVLFPPYYFNHHMAIQMTGYVRCATISRIFVFVVCSSEAVRRHKIALIPGTSCGAPGWVRVSYANIAGEAMQRAASRLRAAVEELTAGVAAGKDVVSEFFQSEKM